MFGNKCLNFFILTIVLFAAGCGASLDVADDLEPNVVLDFDKDYELTETIEEGWLVALSMRSPEKKGHTVIGASFDPDILELVRFYDYQEDGVRRKAYILKAIKDGLSDVAIKMREDKTGTISVYKRAQINVGEIPGFF